MDADYAFGCLIRKAAMSPPGSAVSGVYSMHLGLQSFRGSRGWSMSTVFCRAIVLAAVFVPSAPAFAQNETVQIIKSAPLQYVADSKDSTDEQGRTFTSNGQVVELTAALPPLPENQRDARRIVCTVNVEPQVVKVDDATQIADPWTRLGNVGVIIPKAGTNETQTVELLRFVTGFGGSSTFTQGPWASVDGTS